MHKLLTGLLLVTTMSQALTTEQKQNCANAYKVGKPYSLGTTMAAIAYVESSCGMYKVGPTNDYGIMQINIKTALSRLKLEDTPANRKEASKHLIKNDKLSFNLAIRELVYWKITRNRTLWIDYVSSYNQGNVIDNYDYAGKVMRAVKILREANVIPK